MRFLPIRRNKNRGNEPPPETNPFTRSTAADFEIAKPPRRVGPTITRWGIRALVVLLLVAGANQLFVKPFRAAGTAAPGPATTADADLSGAQLAAARFAADYLTYDPTSPKRGAPALTSDTVSTADVAGMAWAGIGWIAADTVIPGAVTPIDATRSVVAVRARVILAVPDDSASPVEPEPSPPAPLPGLAGNPATIPTGYHVAGSLWLPLQVPVTTSGGQAMAGPDGPVFSADTPRKRIDGEDDSQTGTATRTYVSTLFTAYAQSSTTNTYLTDPGVNLQGLNGAVSLVEVKSWSIRQAGPDGTRTGTARVTWTFKPAVDLTVTQTYDVTTKPADNRWFALAVGPATTIPTDQ